MTRQPLFVTGIGTDIGKTIVSAVIVEQLKADYWKPVQAGDLHYTDSDKIRELISNPKTVIHPESIRLNLAASPHKAAREEQITIAPHNFRLPLTARQLVIEGAGGLFVPLNPDFLIIDLIEQLEAGIVLVVRNYLGCISHTLLSVHAIISRGLPLRHVVFNGDFDSDTLHVIISHIPFETTCSALPEFQAINKYTVANAPTQISNN